MADIVAMTGALAIPLAMLVDRQFGEPPARLHPVVGIGRYLRTAARLVPRSAPAPAFAGGALFWLLGAGGCMLVALLAQGILLALPPWLGALGLALALKPLLAWRMLRDEVAAVEQALARSVEAGRERLGHLVSRDTTRLGACDVREAALESLAENLNDSVVAPLFWFAVAGLPGAALYRFANTADAMWGYRGGEWEWAGKWAARADDLLSWVPARVTALLLCVAAGRWPGLGRLALEARRTPSPNGGWPMGALALLLDVRLGKPGTYLLNARGRRPSPDDTARALRWTALALHAWVAFLFGAEFVDALLAGLRVARP